MIREEEVFRIGRFAKPHGVRGEIALVTQSDVLDSADDDGDLYVVCEMDGILVPFFVEEYRYKTDAVVLLKLADVDDEPAARRLANRDVFYPLSKVAKGHEYGEMTWERFIGFRVEDRCGKEIGTVRDVDDSTANVLLQVTDGEKEFLLPAAEELVVSPDYERKTLVMELPDGLLDL